MRDNPGRLQWTGYTKVSHVCNTIIRRSMAYTDSSTVRLLISLRFSAGRSRLLAFKTCVSFLFLVCFCFFILFFILNYFSLH